MQGFGLRLSQSTPQLSIGAARDESDHADDTAPRLLSAEAQLARKDTSVVNSVESKELEQLKIDLMNNLQQAFEARELTEDPKK